MTTAELEFSAAGKAKSWTVPPARSKNGRPHHVPLPPLAGEQITEALALANGDSAVFPSRSGKVAGHALAVAMARIGATIGAADWPTPHDLRRTCATRLAAAGVRAEDVRAVLNHARTDVTGKHYDLYDRAAEKRAALARWAQMVAAILTSSPLARCRIAVSPVCRRSRARCGRAASRTSTPVDTDAASSTSASPSRTLRVRGSRWTRPCCSSVASSTDSVLLEMSSSRLSSDALMPGWSGPSPSWALSARRRRAARSTAGTSAPFLCSATRTEFTIRNFTAF